MDDHSFSTLHQGRAAELADIAAMDRLAAQAAPQRTLRRYAEDRGLADRRPFGADALHRLTHVLRLG